MIRQVAILTFTLCLMSAHAGAQTTYTLREASDVHQAPTTSSPVIGHAARGRTLELTRDVGDWVEVVWADAANRKGYVRVRFGAVALAAFRDLPAITTAASPSTTSVGTTTASATSGTPDATSPASLAQSNDRPVKARDPLAFELPPHTAGFGMRMDPRFRDFGGAARLWTPSRFGAQLEVTRSTLTTDLAPGHLTTWQFSPAAIYALPDLIRSTVWVRPYVGTGLDLARSTFTDTTPAMSATDTAFGTKVFGGAEATLAGAPQVGVSVDVGYHWLASSFNAFDLSGTRVTIAGHWYFR
jgi:hypothetical protein